MRVENDEMYADWGHWLQAPCPTCKTPLRAHHLHDFAAVVCHECRRNPLLHFAQPDGKRHDGRAMTNLLLKEGLLADVAAEIAGELKADASLPQVVEFLLSMHYVKPDGLEKLVKKKAPKSWVEGMTMTFAPDSGGAAAPRLPQHGDRVDLREWDISAELAKRISRTVARVYRCVPVWADEGHVVLAVENPDKVRAADIAGLLRVDVALVKSPKEQIAEALKTHYGASEWKDAIW